MMAAATGRKQSEVRSSTKLENGFSNGGSRKGSLPPKLTLTAVNDKRYNLVNSTRTLDETK